MAGGRVIDGSRGGNSARWLNQACTPNCETIEDAGRVFVDTLRPIEAGEELSVEYLLAIDDPLGEDVRLQYVCQYSSVACRRSMLADVA